MLLIGGSGFLGTHVARELLGRGHEVLALSRRGSGPLEGVRYLRGDVASGEGLEEAVCGAEAVVYLAGIIRERGQSFEAVHVRGVENAVRAMRACGVKRLLHTSALGARPGTGIAYFETKARGEELVKRSGLDWTVFRPSLVFGAGGEFFARELPRLARLPLPFVPLIGDGSYPFRPVWAGDVARAYGQSLEKPETAGRSFELVGPKEYPFRELVRLVRDMLGVKKPMVSLPVWLFELLSRLPGAPLTRDQLRMLLLGSTADPGPLRRVFELEWRGLEEELPRILRVKSA